MVRGFNHGGFWYGFEKRAMTNKEIFKKYVNNLLAVMKKSKDPTDRSVHKYITSHKQNMDKTVASKIRSLGEGPMIGWKHNIHPEKIKSMVANANKHKHEPGWARSTLLKAIGGVL